MMSFLDNKNDEEVGKLALQNGNSITVHICRKALAKINEVNK